MNKVAQLIKTTGEVTTVTIPKKDSLQIMQLASVIDLTVNRFNRKKDLTALKFYANIEQTTKGRRA